MKRESGELLTLPDTRTSLQAQVAVERRGAELDERLKAIFRALSSVRPRRLTQPPRSRTDSGLLGPERRDGRRPVRPSDTCSTATGAPSRSKPRLVEASKRRAGSEFAENKVQLRDRPKSPLEGIRVALVDDLVRRVPQPLDAFEIAAVIESNGITDSVAREDYGARNVFELAERVFPLVLRESIRSGSAGHEPDDPDTAVREAEAESILEAAGRGLLALAPVILLLVAIQSLAAAGWTAASVLAFSFGVTTAVLITSGPILAIGNRTAVYLGLRYRAAAARFLALGSLLTLSACIVVATALLEGARILGLFGAHERLVFALALVAYAFLWLQVAGLMLAGSSLLAVTGLASGLACGVAIGLAEGATLGLGIGYAVSGITLLAACLFVYRRGEERSFKLPPPSLMVLEAAPCIAFGSVFALLLIEPHILGWVGSTQLERLRAVRTLELSLLLALPPVLLASGVYEQILRSFWVFSKERRQRDTAIYFCRALTRFHRSKFLLYAAALGALSIAVVAAVEIASALGELTMLDQLVFLCGIAGFFFLGLGQFSCFVMLSLSQPNAALKAVLGGVVFQTLIGIPLIVVDFRLAALAFAFGAAHFALLSWTSCRRVIADAGYHFATAF